MPRGRKILRRRIFKFNLIQPKDLYCIFPLAAGNGTPVDSFTWDSVIVKDGQEIVFTEEQQRERYRKYVERNIGAVLKEKRLYVKGVEKSENILSVEVPGRGIDLVGRTDLLILSDIVKENPRNLQHLPEVKMLIEVKRNIKSSCDFQALSELIALDLLVDDPVVALLTDLRGDWVFFWVSGKENNATRIHKAIIKNPDEAFQVIRTLLEQPSTADTEIEFPCFQNPVKRRKLSQVMPLIGEGGESGKIHECIERYYDIAITP
ncbi:hypothetical protein JM18_009726 [Phytophthora kernoviae]|uniref:Crinkler effector protein N-terminal domain-containing protein n=1 Tax=Phytophthora kernoviae TaxID=325452 RepID=A0A921S8I9_9STRA|nr:hypothetical protein JM18_009726 [Phytophthora kernoviae]